ncbi:peptidoglycan-binding protein [Luteipulveratus flavus]|uniref:Peptidoglycan-binding protein n=1 Tax=Luteipulveratus flavus TaxID=3031728 RepID=A0ABT6C4G5_9MICO|nr:peptidoglycan-binding protein [Luteipulveratus sp. YIM 133296]MDF8263839.1 peptidoglycan-binding protein [Luteipulveratus sp. YIM 133296]
MVLGRGGAVVATGAAITVPAGLGAVAAASPAAAATPELGGAPIAAARPPAAAPTAVPTQPTVVVLRYGSSGDLVRVLQNRVGGLSVDGSFGPLTLARVKAYQRSKGLTPDGYVGTATWQALGGFPGSDPAPPTPKPRCEPVTVLRYGWEGTAVSALQRSLELKVDGVFGPATLAAVKVFQGSHGLAADGVVGPQTWAALGGYPCGTSGEPGDAPIGSPDAPYRMPYPDGVRHQITQGPGGSTSHNTVYNRTAIDIGMPSGSTVTAARAGTVQRVGWTSYGAGKQIMIRDDSGRCQVYAHLSAYEVYDGERVARGEVIARSGNTGDTTGPHLHFDIVDCSSLRAIGPANTYERGTSYPSGIWVTSLS